MPYCTLNCRFKKPQVAAIDKIYGGSQWREGLNLDGAGGGMADTAAVNAKLRRLAEDYMASLRRYGPDTLKEYKAEMQEDEGTEEDPYGFNWDHPCVYTIPFAIRKGK